MHRTASTPCTRPARTAAGQPLAPCLAVLFLALLALPKAALAAGSVVARPLGPVPTGSVLGRHSGIVRTLRVGHRPEGRALAFVRVLGCAPDASDRPSCEVDYQAIRYSPAYANAGQRFGAGLLMVMSMMPVQDPKGRIIQKRSYTYGESLKITAGGDLPAMFQLEDSGVRGRVQAFLPEGETVKLWIEFSEDLVGYPVVQALTSSPEAIDPEVVRRALATDAPDAVLGRLEWPGDPAATARALRAAVRKAEKAGWKVPAEAAEAAERAERAVRGEDVSEEVRQAAIRMLEAQLQRGTDPRADRRALGRLLLAATDGAAAALAHLEAAAGLGAPDAEIDLERAMALLRLGRDGEAWALLDAPLAAKVATARELCQMLAARGAGDPSRCGDRGFAPMLSIDEEEE